MAGTGSAMIFALPSAASVDHQTRDVIKIGAGGSSPRIVLTASADRLGRRHKPSASWGVRRRRNRQAPMPGSMERKNPIGGRKGATWLRPYRRRLGKSLGRRLIEAPPTSQTIMSQAFGHRAAQSHHLIPSPRQVFGFFYFLNFSQRGDRGAKKAAF